MSKLGPNDPCHCGSGKKYKKCHLNADRLSGGPAHSNVLSASSGGGTLLAERKASIVANAVASGRADKRIRPGVISARRSVPDHIARPEYAETGDPAKRQPPTILKHADEIERMRAAGRAARRVLNTVCAAVRVGITTDELDEIAHAAYIAEGGYPSPLNYMGFPKSICTSVNEVICHGIPDDRPLQDGDIVNCDVTIYLDGFHGDCSETVLVGNVDDVSKRLVNDTRICMNLGIQQIKPGNRISDIGRAIEAYAKPRGYGIVRDFTGHGIGRFFHTDPQVMHHYERSARTVMVPGMCFTVEPMITLGTAARPDVWPDDWTAVTRDLKRTAQFEQTCMVTESGVEILTANPE